MGLGFRKIEERKFLTVAPCDAHTTEAMLAQAPQNAFGDFDNDAIPDRLGVEGQRLLLYKGTWDPTVNAIRFASSGVEVYTAKRKIGISFIGDFDGDGDLDVKIHELGLRCDATEVTLTNTQIERESTALPANRSGRVWPHADMFEER